MHVWTSATFRECWRRIERLLGLEALVLFESTAMDNGFEYFAVVQKGSGAGSGAPRDDRGAGSGPGVHGTVWAGSLGERIGDLEASLEGLQRELADRDWRLWEIQASRAWRLASGLWRVRERRFPAGTRRRRLYEAVVRRLARGAGRAVGPAADAR